MSSGDAVASTTTSADGKTQSSRKHKKFAEFWSNVFIKRSGSSVSSSSKNADAAAAEEDASSVERSKTLTKTSTSSLLSMNTATSSVLSSRRSSTSGSLLLESERHTGTLETNTAAAVCTTSFSAFDDTDSVDETPVSSHTSILSPPFPITTTAACSSASVEPSALISNQLSYSVPSVPRASSPLTRSPSQSSLTITTSMLSSSSHNFATVAHTAPLSNTSRKKSQRKSRHLRSKSFDSAPCSDKSASASGEKKSRNRSACSASLSSQGFPARNKSSSRSGRKKSKHRRSRSSNSVNLSTEGAPARKSSTSCSRRKKHKRSISTDSAPVRGRKSKSRSTSRKSKHRHPISSESVPNVSYNSQPTSISISVTSTVFSSLPKPDMSTSYSSTTSQYSHISQSLSSRHTPSISSRSSPSGTMNQSRKYSYSCSSLPSPITIPKSRSESAFSQQAGAELPPTTRVPAGLPPMRTSWRDRFTRARVRATSETPSSSSSSRRPSLSASSLRHRKKTSPSSYSSPSSSTRKSSATAFAIKRRFTARKSASSSSNIRAVKLEREHVSWMGIDDVPDGDSDTEPVLASSDSEDAASDTARRRSRRNSSRRSSRRESIDREEAEEESERCRDYLGVRNDLNLKGLFVSIGFGAERVVYSDHANLVIISDSVARSPESPISKSKSMPGASASTNTTKKKNSLPKTLSLLTKSQSASSASDLSADGDSNVTNLPRAEEYAVVVTNQALYLFAPQIESGRVRHLICNCYVRFKLSEILGVSLPYRSRDSSGGQEYALRSDEFAVHLVGHVTLWLEAYPGKRSEFAEAVSMAYEKLLAQELPMEHPDRDELVRSCVSDNVWLHVLECGDAVWAKSPILKQGWLYHQVFVPDDPSKTEWRRRWCALSVSQIRYFNNPEEMEALRFLIRSPKNKRAKLPDMSRDDEITLGLYHLYKISFTPEEGVTDYGFEIANVDFRDVNKDCDLINVDSRSLARMHRFRHVFRCKSREEATHWILAIQTRFSTQQRRARRMRLKAQRAFEEELKSLRLQEAELLRAAQKKEGAGTKSAPSSSDGSRARTKKASGLKTSEDSQNNDPQIPRHAFLSTGQPRKEKEADLDHPTHRRSSSSPVSLSSRVLSPLSFSEVNVNNPQVLLTSGPTSPVPTSDTPESNTASADHNGPLLHRFASATSARGAPPREVSSPANEDADACTLTADTTVTDPLRSRKKRTQRRCSRELDVFDGLEELSARLNDVSVSGVQKSFHTRSKSTSAAAGSPGASATKLSKSGLTMSDSPPRSLTAQMGRR